MHQDRGDIKMHIILLSPFEPNDDVLNLLQHRKYETRLTYIKGSVMDNEAMDRAKAHDAKAFFVCVNKYDSVQLAHEEDMVRLPPDSRMIMLVLNLCLSMGSCRLTAGGLRRQL